MRKTRKLKGSVKEQSKSDFGFLWMNISCSKQIIGIGWKGQIYKEFRNLRRMATADAALVQNTEKLIVHYEHTDDCRAFRWTARECYQYLYDRPWNEVLNFYSHLTAGRLSLLNLFSEGVKEVCCPLGSCFLLLRRCCSVFSLLFGRRSDCEEHSSVHFKNTAASPSFGELFLNNREEAKGGKWARRTFKILLSYDGTEFEGWQKQPGLHTVQGLVEQALGKFVDEKKAQELKAKEASVEATVAVAGRTDKGVSAVQQVCSFYTWRKDVNSEDVEKEINAAAPEKLRVVSVYEVPRIFHPNFSARWRRYLYILPLKCGEGYETFETDERMCTEAIDMESMSIGDLGKSQSAVKPHNFSIAVVNRLLQQLEGRSLSYKIFSRDTQASRSRGPATECFMYHARATVAKLPCWEQDHARKGRNVMCVELVANRFLRKMVRVLVATAIREAAAGAADDTLLKLMDATCRRASAPPAPPGGLCLVDIGYEDINQEIFLIG